MWAQGAPASLSDVQAGKARAMSESTEGRASGKRQVIELELEDCAGAARAVRLGRAWRRAKKQERNERTRSRGGVRAGVAGDRLTGRDGHSDRIPGWSVWDLPECPTTQDRT